MLTNMFDNQWFLNNQKLLRWFANTKYGKSILGHRLDKVDLILPSSVFKKEGKLYTAEFRTHDKYAKRLFYEFQSVWKAFHWFDENIANVYIPKLNLGFDSLTFYPNSGGVNTPYDAILIRFGVDESFATIKAGAGNATNSGDGTAMNLTATATTDQYSDYRRFGINFDTSALTSNVSIISAILSVRATAKNNGLGDPTLDIVDFTPGNVNSPANADYNATSATSFASIAYASYSTASYNDFTLSAGGIANINKIGVSSFAHVMGWDITGSPTWSSGLDSSVTPVQSEASGTTDDPKLVVNFAFPTSLDLTSKIW